MIHLQNYVFFILLKTWILYMNVISRTNEARCLKWHEACKWKCRLDESVCNNKERWNEDKWRRECKELVGKGICDKGFNWNPSKCECDKIMWCWRIFKCRKRLVDKLVEKCNENIDGKKLHPNKIIYN